MVCLGATIAMGTASAGDVLNDRINECAAFGKSAQFGMHGYMTDQNGRYVKRTVSFAEKSSDQYRVVYDVTIEHSEYNPSWNSVSNARYYMDGESFQSDNSIATRFAKFSSIQSQEQEITSVNDIVDGKSHQYSFEGCVAK